MTFAVRVQPRAGRTEVVGVHDGALKVRLTAPPLEGRANRELVRFLAAETGLPKTSVAIVRGLRSRNKTIAIKGITAGRLVELFGRFGV